jgi:cell division protein FtsL
MNGHHGQKYHYHLQDAGADSRQVSGNRAIVYLLVIVVIVALLVTLVLLHINQYAQLSRKNLEIERLKEKRNKLKSDVAHLQLEVSSLMSLKRIERIATEELGMKRPEEINYLSLDNNKEEASLNSTPESAKQAKQESLKNRFVSWLQNLAGGEDSG